MGAYSSTHLTPEEIQELEDKTHCQCDQLDATAADVLLPVARNGWRQ
jgi:hypothetical protein